MEVVDLKAYWEQVSRFSQYPEDRRADGYALGLLAEAGEVCGVVDKWLRNKYDEAEMKRRLVDELGDCAWFCVARLDYLLGGEFFDLSLDCNEPLNLFYDVQQLFHNAIYLSYEPLDADYEVQSMMCYIGILATYADTTLQAVLENNVAKLTERYGQ